MSARKVEFNVPANRVRQTMGVAYDLSAQDPQETLATLLLATAQAALIFRMDEDLAVEHARRAYRAMAAAAKDEPRLLGRMG